MNTHKMTTFLSGSWRLCLQVHVHWYGKTESRPGRAGARHRLLDTQNQSEASAYVWRWQSHRANH